jgi:hypothetical protein
MIYKPTTAQLIDAVRHDLRENVAPFITDSTARVALDMSLLVLGTALVRSRNEVAWMLEEVDAIEKLARQFVERFPDDAALAEALGIYDTYRTSGHGIDEVNADYERASELFSRATEAAYKADDQQSVRQVMALFEQRREHQNAASGGYEAIGRS